MFLKGVITDEISQDFDTATALAAKYGLDGVEIRSVWEKSPHELDHKEIGRIKEILADKGLKVCGISSPFFKCDIDSMEEIGSNIEILKRTVDMAHQVGTKLVRGFTFWNKGVFEDSVSKIISRFEEPLKILEKEGITLVLEFDPSVFTTNAGKLVRIIEGIDSEYVKGLWDPGNDIYDPDKEVPFPDGYNLIKPHMVHMHLKDAIRHPDGKIEGVPVGEGQVDYVGQFTELIKSGYDGFVVLETHYRPKHDIGEELLALPKGSAFSYLGYEATEECLVKWGRLLDRVTGKTGK